MSLPFPPQLTHDAEQVTDDLVMALANISTDILAIHNYLYSIIGAFPNAVGSAIDPSEGQGGDGALTITDIITDITYTPSIVTNRDGGNAGIINITFTLPARAIGALVYYKESNASQYHSSFAISSPYALSSLPIGSSYDIFLVPQSANGSIGPASAITTVTMPFTGLAKVTGQVTFDIEPEGSEQPWIIPGPIGPTGARGQPGIPGLNGIDAEEAYFIITAPTKITP